MDYFDQDWDLDDFLEEAQQTQQQRLEKELERIQDQLERRDQLKKEALEELESKLDWYLERLENEYRTRGPSSVEQLKSEVNRFYSLIRDEKQQHWKDTQRLERERRQLLRDLQEIDELDFQDLF